MPEQFTFFWKSKIAQWNLSTFLFEGMSFNTAEQFMMFGKAVLFEDYETASRIMGASHPREQKNLGREVARFDVGVWAKVARDIVYAGNYCKFSQNPVQCKELMQSQGTTLVEASPYDKIWGVALGKDDPRIQTRATWRGKNWLGETLSRVREDLLLVTRDEQSFRLAKGLVAKYQEYQEAADEL